MAIFVKVVLAHFLVHVSHKNNTDIQMCTRSKTHNPRAGLGTCALADVAMEAYIHIYRRSQEIKFLRHIIKFSLLPGRTK